MQCNAQRSGVTKLGGRRQGTHARTHAAPVVQEVRDRLHPYAVDGDLADVPHGGQQSGAYDAFAFAFALACAFSKNIIAPVTAPAQQPSRLTTAY